MNTQRNVYMRLLHRFDLEMIMAKPLDFTNDRILEVFISFKILNVPENYGVSFRYSGITSRQD